MVESHDDFLEYMECVRENFDYIYQVKSAVANEEWESLQAIVEEESNEVKEALNLAPSNGGIFTTFEIKVMKINPSRSK